MVEGRDDVILDLSGDLEALKTQVRYVLCFAIAVVGVHSMYFNKNMERCPYFEGLRPLANIAYLHRRVM